MKAVVRRLVTALAACTWIGALASAPVPEYYPLCSSPQDIMPLQPAGGVKVPQRTAVVWNGQDYALAWVDAADSRLHFRRVFADGTPVANATTPSSLAANPYCAPSLVWNGAGYGVAWAAVAPTGYYQIYFALLDADGALLGSEVKVSNPSGGETSSDGNPSLAWSGADYGLVYENGYYEYVYAAVLSQNGTVQYSDAYMDTSGMPGNALPAVAWSTTDTTYVAAWTYFDGTATSIHSATFTTGAPPYGVFILTSPGGNYDPCLADMGNGLGMAWTLVTGGYDQIVFSPMLADGAGLLGTTVQLTSDSNDHDYPQIVWTGAEFGVFWQGSQSGGVDLWFQRVSAAGALQGGNVRVTATAGTGSPGAAFARYGFMATGSSTNANRDLLQPFGCSSPSSPPCPGNVIAYGVGGSDATISWQPVSDGSTDTAYYQVYRDNALLADTDNTYYTDTTLVSGTTYNYLVQAVNAAQQVSTGCGSTTASSVYVKASASLVLTLDKSDPNAVLTWTDTSGQTLPSYNVYRGTSPQVMSQVATSSTGTYTDPDALTNTVLYFYTVDDPGQ